MTTTFPATRRSTVARASRRLVALVLLLCVGSSSVEVLFGNEPVTAAPALASGTDAGDPAPVPVDHHEDEGCPCFCACGCTGAVLTVAPTPMAFFASETVKRVDEIQAVLRPAHRTTPPRARPPLA